jgi:hypothetical protein
LISLPPGTEMFQFPGFALAPERASGCGMTRNRVSPFGHPGLTGRVLLPPAYRSLPRPSSPPCAQASPARLRSLDYIKTDIASRARAIRSKVLSDNREIVSRDDSYPTIYHTSVVKQRCVAAALVGRPPRSSCNRDWEGMCRDDATIEELSDRPRAVARGGDLTRNPLRR